MTRWTMDLVLRRGDRSDPAVNDRIKELLYQMGGSKLEYMAEEEIRSYGTACVIPISKFVEDERSKEKPKTRQKAIRILSDNGDWFSVPALIKLLDESDKDNKNLAIKGLERISGQNYGDNKSKWTTWWQDNDERQAVEDLNQIWKQMKEKFDKKDGSRMKDIKD